MPTAAHKQIAQLVSSVRSTVTHHFFLISVAGASLVCLVAATIFFQIQAQTLRDQYRNEEQKVLTLTQQLHTTESNLHDLLNEDQYQRNEQLESEIESIQKVYAEAVTQYEQLQETALPAKEQAELDADFASVLAQLSERQYASASDQLAEIKTTVQKLAAAQATQVAQTLTAPAIQEAPASGYQRQQVNTEIGTFIVDIIAADLNSTRVQVETASESDCGNDCPVSSLGDFVARSGGYAGINGPYFCPASYPSCAGKTNSFDTLLMNKNKTYFNSDNNVYSTVPAVIFSGSSARFVGASQEWGRDTSVDAVIANQPLVIRGGQVAFNGDGDPKKGSRGPRSFIGATGSTVYIGVVRAATVAEVGYVLKAMGVENGLNLDSGGSTAMIWNGKYVAGPGRNTPFGIVLVRK